MNLPAEALPGDQLGRAPGEMLWDTEYGYGNFLRSEKATQTPRNWSALYQQAPVPDSGNFFQDEWLRAYISPPPRDTLSVYGASDYAVTDNGGDYTVHVVLGLDPEDRLYLLDMWRGQTAANVWVDQWCALVKKWRPLDWAEETGQITGAIGPYRDAEANRQRAYTHCELIPHRGLGKAARAQSIRAHMGRAGGGLWCPVRAPWYADFGPSCSHSRPASTMIAVDALALCGMLLDMMVPGRAAEKAKLVKVKPGYKPVSDLDRHDEWKSY